MKHQIFALLLALILTACAPAGDAQPAGPASSGATTSGGAGSASLESPSLASAEAESPSAEENPSPTVFGETVPDAGVPGMGRNYGAEGSGKEVGPKFLFVQDPDAESYLTPLIFATDEEDSDLPVNWTTPQMIGGLEPFTRCDADTREDVLEKAAAVSDWDEQTRDFLVNSPVYLVHAEKGRLAGGETEFRMYKLGPGMSPYVLMAETGGQTTCYPLDAADTLLTDFRVMDMEGDGVSEILLRRLHNMRYSSWKAALYRVGAQQLEPIKTFDDFDTGFQVTIDDDTHYTVKHPAVGYEKSFSFRPYEDYWVDRNDEKASRFIDIREDLVLVPEVPPERGAPMFTRFDRADLDGDGADEILTAELASGGYIDWGRKYTVLKYDPIQKSMAIKEAIYMPRKEGMLLKEWLNRTDELYYTGTIKEEEK